MSNLSIHVESDPESILAFVARLENETGDAVAFAHGDTRSAAVRELCEDNPDARGLPVTLNHDEMLRLVAPARRA